MRALRLISFALIICAMSSSSGEAADKATAARPQQPAAKIPEKPFDINRDGKIGPRERTRKQTTLAPLRQYRALWRNMKAVGAIR
jgi:hypothetical protein